VAAKQEVWELSNVATGGTFKLNFNGHDGTDLNFDASAQEIQDALNAASVNAGVTVASAIQISSIEES